MENALLGALPNEPVLQSNALATVTSNCVVIRSNGRAAQSIVSVSRITDVTRVKTTYPGLLVIAAALGLVATAAYYSKQGDGATVPMAVLAVVFLIIYIGARKASVLFSMDGETVETPQGGLRQASAIVKAVNKARTAYKEP